MARRQRKARTHNLKPDARAAGRTDVPKTFVVKAGHVGSSVASLVADVRRLLEPNTASRLKERKRNRLRDYVAMSGPLGVSHMLLFSQTPAAHDAAALSNVNLRLSRMPRGPTLTFKVIRYALARDVLAASRHPHSPGKEFATEPLLILNNFASEERQVKLMTTVFQNLFPAIHVQSMPLSAARRVVLLSYNPATRTVDLRHYLVAVRPVGVSKPIRKIIEGSTTNARRAPSAAPKGVPDLSRASDVAEYVLHHADLGYATSASEAESDVDDVGAKRVELAASYVGRSNRRAPGADATAQQRALRLVELGPRLELGLVKVEDGLGGNEGEVMFHELVSKTPAEVAALAKKRKEREQRRKMQEARVKAKQAAAATAVQATGSPAAQRTARFEDSDASDAFEEVAPDDDAGAPDDDDDFAYEDLFDEGAGVDPDHVLDEVLVDDGGSAAGDSDDSDDGAPKPAKRAHTGDRAKPKFTLRRGGAR